MKKTILVLVAGLIAVASHAALVLDQHQDTIDLGSAGEGFLVGSPQEYMLAQTVTAGISGSLARVEVPAVCEGGALEVEIRNVVEIMEAGTLMPIPGTRVLGRGSADASEFPASGGFVFRPIDLDRAVRMSAGDEFAIVFKNETGSCGVGMGWSIDLYPRGRSIWRYAGTPPDVWLSTGGFADPIDMAFRTYVETGPSRRAGFVPCRVTGFGPIPIPEFVPLCRCVQDASSREMRCGFFHPSMFLFRTLPSPLIANQPFEVKWTLLALKPLKGIVEVDDVLPPGFHDAKNPLVFFGEQVPVGESLTLSYEAVAGPKAGSFKVETRVAIADEQQKLDDGTLRSVIEVAPQ